MSVGWCRAVVYAGVAAFALAGCSGRAAEPRDEHGTTALMRAAAAGDLGTVERLVQAGADVNAAVPTREFREFIAFISWMQQLPHWDVGFTPLHYAAKNGHAGVVRLLIARGADVTKPARGAETAFDLALGRSDLETMRLLASAGARPTAAQLRSAVGSASLEAIRFLVDQGADLAAAEAAGRTPTSSPRPLAIVAVTRGDAEILAFLIERGLDVSAVDQNGWSALRWARDAPVAGRRADTARLVELLEDAGATDDVGARAARLIEAVRARDLAGVRAALDGGADPDAADHRGIPPLVHAATRGDADIAAALVEAGADVNASPKLETTPLVGAVIAGRLDIVRMLTDAGARIDQPDHLKRTPLQVASSWGRTEITAHLLSLSASADPAALATAALNGNVEQVRLLLARGADVNASGGYVLREAARGCGREPQEEAIRLLLAAGADPRGGGKTFSALHHAAARCSPGIVSLMLARGADANAPDLSDFTPLMSAAMSGAVDNLRLLLAAGARVNARDADGKSVLDYAARHAEVQAELRRAGAR